jgi:hypothetical protein
MARMRRIGSQTRVTCNNNPQIKSMPEYQMPENSKSPSVEHLRTSEANIHLYFSILNNVLLISCSHKYFSAFAGSKAQEAKSTLISANIKDETSLRIWLQQQFAVIRAHPSYPNVKMVVYVGDVNLGYPSEKEYPHFLTDDFMESEFLPNSIKKILYSANEDVVLDALKLNIKNARIVTAAKSGIRARETIREYRTLCSLSENGKPSSLSSGDPKTIKNEIEPNKERYKFQFNKQSMAPIEEEDGKKLSGEPRLFDA